MESAGRHRGRIAAALWLLACAIAFAGHRAYWFLTDDAFIAFRYVSQRQLGHGYVWNAPPFLPVEGYSSFLWVALLDGIWSALGVEPPDSANVVSLLCSLASLALVAVWVRTRWTDVTRPARFAGLLGVALLLIASNRSFLVWSSSGLETALFNLLVLLWLFLAFGIAARPRSAPMLAAVAVLLALARPDGLLFCAATCVLLLALAIGRVTSWRRTAVSLAVLATVAVHLFWRRAYYGSWLPNTYYAKVGAPWPEAGVRYVVAFALEYGLWFWLIVIALALPRALRAARADVAARPAAVLARLVASAALVGHLAYYVFVVGGDHFEFRVLSHLVPPIALVFARALAHVPAVRAALACGALLVFANVIPWTHFALTRDLETREQTQALLVPVAPALPPPFSWIAQPFDVLQRWLIPHGVGTRHKEHEVFAKWQAAQFPSRARGLAMRAHQPNPVHVHPCVGIPGWTLPRVHVLDTLGLNDYVIARSPRPGSRFMGHERGPPRGYLEAFAPNIGFDARGKLVEVRRRRPLTDQRIRELERQWRALADRWAATP